MLQRNDLFPELFECIFKQPYQQWLNKEWVWVCVLVQHVKVSRIELNSRFRV